MDFQGKVALVTGGASGIGKSTALLYASGGAAVLISDMDQKGGEAVAADIRKNGGKAAFAATDVSNPADCERMVQAALDQFGRLDIACNNAGIGGESKPSGEMSVEGWQKVLSVNLSGVFYCMRFEIPAMLKTGGGAIVNMSSILGTVGFAGSPGYVAAKHGVVGLTRNAALEYSSQGIRVNAVGPGFISTPLLADLEKDPATMEMLVGLHPIGRLGRPEEVAELVVWLSSDKASFVTGAYYPIDGGYLAR